MIRAALLAAAVAAAGPTTAAAQSIRSHDLTSGACMVACDDVSFCRTTDYDKARAICTMHLDPNDPGFKAVQQQCPDVAPENWVITDANERWSIGCPTR